MTYFNSVDGDTAKFVIDEKVTTVRFLGIDTPETVHPAKKVESYGLEASQFTKQMLENADTIVLEFDEYADETDRYGRLLTWVWIDGELLQEKLLENGLAVTYMTKNKYKYIDKINKAQSIAKEAKIGVWSEEEYNPTEEDTNIISEINNTENIDNNNIIAIIMAVVLAIVVGVIELLKNKDARKR